MTIFEELEAYYAQHLSGRELRQFRKAGLGRPCRLLTEIIQPNAYRPDRGTYMGVEPRNDVSGRSHLTARELVAGNSDWEFQSLFTNTLRIAHSGELDFGHPKNRAVLGPFYIHTFEFDSKDMEFFKQQLSWMRSSKHPLDAPIGKFVTELRKRYADCVGLNVTYSGNKSFHFHFVFSTDLLAARVPTPTSLRAGLVKSWERLSRDLTGSLHLAIPQTEDPDPSLKFPEWYRRLPGGHRLVGTRHMFGVPEGTPVPQLCMFEHLTLDRRGSGKASVFETADFLMTRATLDSRKSARATGGQKSAVTIFDEGSEEEQHCAGKMRSIYNGESVWPRFEGFRREPGGLRAFFSNSPSDQNPQSYMDETFRTVFVQGSNPLLLTNDRDGPGLPMPRLPKPLGEMVEIWTTAYRRRFLAPGGRERTPFEQEFADGAVDKKSATMLVGETLDRLITEEITAPECHTLCAPEGISKSRSLIGNTARFHDLLRENNLPGLTMFAFQTYESATDKAAEFNAAYGAKRHYGKRFIAIVLPSFSRLYDVACKKLGVRKISLTDAGEAGFPTMVAAIEKLQPEVVEDIRQFFEQQRRMVGGREPVIFTVHDVAHDWNKSNPTRLMFSGWWWSDRPENERRARAREDTELGLLIHDEVSAENLLTVVPMETISWVRQLAATPDPANRRRKLWPSNATLTRSHSVFTDYAASNPPPHDLTFDRAYEIRGINDWEMVTSTASNEYGERTPAPGHEDIYAATAGRSWGIHVKQWPSTSAHKTIILTTEAVPTVIARKIGSPLLVTELDTPAIPRDVVTVKASREVISSKLASLVSDEKAAHLRECGRELAAIGNKMAHVVGTRTHVGAKGSNAYIGKDILQTMTPMAPEQYAFFEALNAWTGRDDLVRLRHLDEFNQTAGRNLGFRAPPTGPTPAHTLLINRRLFESLAPLMDFARYEMREVLSQHIQKSARAQARQPGAFVAPPSRDSKDRLAAIRAALLAKREAADEYAA